MFLRIYMDSFLIQIENLIAALIRCEYKEKATTGVGWIDVYLQLIELGTWPPYTRFSLRKYYELRTRVMYTLGS